MSETLSLSFPDFSKTKRLARIYYTAWRSRHDSNIYATHCSSKRWDVVVSQESLYLYDTAAEDELLQAAIRIDGLVIEPLQTFSFWTALQTYSLPVTTSSDTCLSRLATLIHRCLLKSGLSVLEHPEADSICMPCTNEQPAGLRLNLEEGLRDLKYRNGTHFSYQLSFERVNGSLIVKLRCSEEPGVRYLLSNEHLSYQQKGKTIFESIDVIQERIPLDHPTHRFRRVLYRTCTPIRYVLPEHTTILKSSAQ